MRPDREYELKLVGDASAIRALEHSFVIRALQCGAPAKEAIEATYFDTPDGALAADGVSLRIRRSDDEVVQTVKAESAGGASFHRFEHETAILSEEVWPLETGRVDIDHVVSDAAESLRAMLRIDTQRRAIALSSNGSDLEAAFDFCTTERPHAEDRPVQFAEAEIELVAGDPAALFKVARLCLEEMDGRLRLSATSKRVRAISLLTGVTEAPSNRIPIDAQADAGDALARAAEFCARRLLEAAPLVTELGDGEGLKQLRVALRRFRSIERLFRHDVSGRFLRRHARQAREMARVLGVARDWEVFITSTLRSLEATGQAPPGLGLLRDAAKTRRAAAWNEARALVDHPDFSIYALDLMEAAHTEPWRGADGGALSTPVNIFARRALDDRLVEARLLASDLSEAAPAAGHPLRIALKKMRYAAQLFRDLYPREARKPYMAAMSRMQDAFGVLNDAVVAQTLSSQAAEGGGSEAAHAAGFVSGYRAAEASAAVRAIIDGWAAFDEMTPFWRA